ncbi:hypothetical protein GUJ93_ZPchr0012g19666 [Zizania palustris]|uniref:Uncharacterized protein n=1 Tax=Zizania palustris TaxID=103762 RepID=A0A8J5WTM3_ZIZPA|nr:hypothetical protein GUJ93_ZPchr0012g19666 [Zizania palustris]
MESGEGDSRTETEDPHRIDVEAVLVAKEENLRQADVGGDPSENEEEEAVQTKLSIINMLRDNKAEGVQLVSDHEHALKVLHTLDPKILEIKLKATEVDTQLRSNLTGSGSKSLALATPSVDPSSVSCAGFSLMSITED